MRINRKRIYAASEDDFNSFDDESFDDDSQLNDHLDQMSDQLDDMTDQLEEITEDDPNIMQENNIAGHYIAECENCSGIFISAITENEEKIESIHGICPICDKESDQYLKWIINDVDYEL